jgi:hypothetical protein
VMNWFRLFLPFPKPPFLCESNPARSTTCVGEKKVPRIGATAAASSITATKSLSGPSSGAQDYQEVRTTTASRLVSIGLAALSVLAIGQKKTDSPRILLNITSSVPTGVYLVSLRQPKMGSLVILRLPLSFPYLPSGTPLIKRIAARTGYIVCRHGPLVTINGRPLRHSPDG